jgi:hypothetical protein
MEKILLLLSLFLTLTVSGQVRSGVVASTGIAAGGESPPSYTDQYQTVLDAMTTHPTGDTLAWQNELVDSLVTFGGTTKYWNRMPWLYIFAVGTNGDNKALINWVNPGTFNAQLVNAPGWLKNSGYKSDGSTSYINTAWDPVADSSKYKRNNASIGIYVTVSAGLENSSVLGNAQNGITPLYSTQWLTATINGNGPLASGQSARPTGFFMVTRTARTLSTVYSNGVSRGTDASASNTLNSNDWRILHDWFNYSSRRVGIAFAGLSFTTKEVAQLNRFFERYMDHIGSGTQP